jgi:hypothetical protein
MAISRESTDRCRVIEPAKIWNLEPAKLWNQGTCEIVCPDPRNSGVMGEGFGNLRRRYGVMNLRRSGTMSL